MKILQSASKLVFVFLAFAISITAVIVLFKTKDLPIEVVMIVLTAFTGMASAASTYYFTQAGAKIPTVPTSMPTEPEVEHLGVNDLIKELEK